MEETYYIISRNLAVINPIRLMSVVDLLRYIRIVMHCNLFCLHVIFKLFIKAINGTSYGCSLISNYELQP